MKKFSIIILNTFLILIFINFIIVFFPQKIIKKKYLNNQLIQYFGFLYHVYYTDTFNRNLKEIEKYSVFVGDSYALGSGENKKNDGIAYYFKKENPKGSFLQIGYPAGPYDFQEKILYKVVKKIKKKPEEIYLFIYEGNDFYDELSFNSKNKKEILLKNFKLNTYNYFPIFAYPLEIIYYKISSYGSENKKTLIEKPKNEIFFGSKKIIIKGGIQNACSSLKEKQLNAFQETFSNYLNIIDYKYPDSKKFVIYIPSPASLYEYKEVYSKNFINNEFETYNFKKNLKCNEDSVKLVKKIINQLKLEKLLFFNSTPELQVITKKELIHGLYDFNHFNSKGYQIFADILLRLKFIE